MRVDVGKLGMEVLLSQPAPPPQCVSSSRSSPAIGAWSDEPGVSRAENQSTEREMMFPLQVSMDVFCLSAAQARIRSVFFLPSRASSLTSEEGRQRKYYLCVEMNILSSILFACLFLCLSEFVFFCLVCSISKQVRETREFPLNDGSDWDANVMRELL